MDTLSNEKGIKWELNPGKALIITFAGMASRLIELEHFEFVRTTRHADCSKIYCLDNKYVWYQQGLNEDLDSISKTATKLQELIEEAQPTHLRLVGVSAGGFAAIMFGYLLKADTVHAFGPQTFLTPELEQRYYEEGMEAYDTFPQIHQLLSEPPLVDYYVPDLRALLSESNGHTKYFLHVGKGSKKDVIYAKHIENCLGVEIKYYGCASHACATHVIQQQVTGGLSAVILGDIL
jgi:hypothetical protein